MPQQPIIVHGLNATEIHEKIDLLIDNLVNIKDTSGKFLLKLDDGRVIDTKGWNDWECVSFQTPPEHSLTTTTTTKDGPTASAFTAYGNITT
jgi:hypothetical protein